MANAPSNTPAFWAGLDPNNAGALQEIQRQQMLGQLLLQQGLAPAPQTQSIGGVAIRQSPVEGLARLLQAHSGNKMQSDAAAQLGYLNRQGYASMTGQPTMADPNQGPQPDPNQPPQASPTTPAQQALSQGAAQGSVGPTNNNAQLLAAALQNPPQQPQQPPQAPQQMPQQMPQQQGAPLSAGGSLNPAGLSPQLAGFGLMTDPSAYFTVQAGAMTPTPEMKLAAAVYGQNSPQYKAALRQQVQKAGYIPPSNSRPGSTLFDPITHQPIFSAPTSDGSQIQWGPNGPTMGMVPGALATSQAITTAQGLGKQAATPTVAYNGTNPIFSTGLQDIQRAGGAPGSPGVPGVPGVPGGSQGMPGNGPSYPGAPGSPEAVGSVYTPDSMAILQAERAKPTNSPADNAALDREISRVQAAMGTPGQTAAPSNVTPTLPPGANTAADAAQTLLSKKFGDLQAQNSQAQSVTSYLESIKQLSQKAAVGPFSDKLQFTNGLLSLIGNEKATDATTANNLLDKYSNQLVARLGQGSLGTDAARTIVHSAYPNSGMTPQAIGEAADNLVGANDMVKAKTSLLSPQGNAKDPIGYQQKEQIFDQAADPRLFQLKRMTPQQGQAYLSSLPPQVSADLKQRAQVLKQLGVF